MVDLRPVFNHAKGCLQSNQDRSPVDQRPGRIVTTPSQEEWRHATPHGGASPSRAPIRPPVRTTTQILERNEEQRVVRLVVVSYQELGRGVRLSTAQCGPRGGDGVRRAIPASAGSPSLSRRHERVTRTLAQLLYHVPGVEHRRRGVSPAADPYLDERGDVLRRG
jgi:hypothetical protein